MDRFNPRVRPRSLETGFPEFFPHPLERKGRVKSGEQVFLISVDWIQKEPPIHSQRAGMDMRARNPRAASGPWNLGGMRSFIGCSYWPQWPDQMTPSGSHRIRSLAAIVTCGGDFSPPCRKLRLISVHRFNPQVDCQCGGGGVVFLNGNLCEVIGCVSEVARFRCFGFHGVTCL